MDSIGNHYITLNLFYTMMSEYDRKSVIAMAKYMHEAFTTRNKFFINTPTPHRTELTNNKCIIQRTILHLNTINFYITILIIFGNDKFDNNKASLNTTEEVVVKVSAHYFDAYR